MSITAWNIDVAHTGIHFSVRHMVVSRVRGRFTKFSGIIRLGDPDVSQSVVEATVDASSVDTGVARTSLDRRAFGLTWNQVLETGGLVVGDRVDIEVDVQAIRPAAPRLG